MKFFVTYIKKFYLVADSPFNTVFVIILRIKIPDEQVMNGENNDHQKNNFMEKSPSICNQSMSIAGINESAENYSKTRKTPHYVKTYEALYIKLLCPPGQGGPALPETLSLA